MSKDRLLSDEELKESISSYVLGTPHESHNYSIFANEVAKRLLPLIQSQKRLYAEMVIGEDLSLAEYRPNLIPAPDVETAIQIEGKNRHNELLKEQRARIK